MAWLPNGTESMASSGSGGREHPNAAPDSASQHPPPCGCWAQGQNTWCWLGTPGTVSGWSDDRMTSGQRSEGHNSPRKGRQAPVPPSPAHLRHRLRGAVIKLILILLKDIIFLKMDKRKAGNPERFPAFCKVKQLQNYLSQK